MLLDDYSLHLQSIVINVAMTPKFSRPADSLPPLGQTTFDMIVQYLQEAEHMSTDASTVNSRDAAPRLLQQIDLQFANIEELFLQLQFFWSAILLLIKQVPESHPWQKRITSLHTALRNGPPCHPLPEYIEEMGLPKFTFWTDLPEMAKVWANFNTHAPHRIPRLSEEIEAAEDGLCLKLLTAIQWCYLNAYIARLHSKKTDLQHLDIRGLLALIGGLEEGSDGPGLDDLVTSACCWLIYAGGALRTNRIPYRGYGPLEEPETAKRLPWSHEDLHHGPHAFNHERWVFWKDRLITIRQNHDLSTSTL